MPPNDNAGLRNEIMLLKKDLDALRQTYFLNNFPTSQDYPKYSRFNTRLKIPQYDSLPATCERGEICESNGVLKVCSAADTWTTAGVQTP